MVNPGVCWSKAPIAGTGVTGSGVNVVVGVLPLSVELTIWRLEGAVGDGVTCGLIERNTPVAPSTPAPTASAAPTPISGIASRRQIGAGFRSVTRHARGFLGERRTGARVGTSQR
jgi:hypothetical protein